MYEDGRLAADRFHSIATQQPNEPAAEMAAMFAGTLVRLQAALEATPGFERHRQEMFED